MLQRFLGFGRLSVVHWLEFCTNISRWTWWIRVVLGGTSGCTGLVQCSSGELGRMGPPGKYFEGRRAGSGQSVKNMRVYVLRTGLVCATDRGPVSSLGRWNNPRLPRASLPSPRPSCSAGGGAAEGMAGGPLGPPPLQFTRSKPVVPGLLCY